ncbi:MAG TPA: pyridoxal-phosphate dependent enzyme, partial [Gemmatimonadota bacterium]|nr:pyridoxal-phosphate dependent enzyme [Gemmatimonadota bacterium]
MNELAIGYEDVLAASRRIRPHVHRTPVMTSRLVDEAASMQLFFKCENFQRAGAFKARGAFNKLLSLSEKER